MQPFLSHNIGRGWYLSSAPTMTANWEASRGNKWTVPVGGYNAVKPGFGSDWQLPFQVQFLLPSLQSKPFL